MFRSFIGIVSLFVVVSLVSAVPAAAADCVTFEGLQHCALGSADLSLVNQGAALRVDAFDPNGGDGVAIDLGGGATQWSAVLRRRLDAGDSFVSTAVAGGQVASRAVVREGVMGHLAITASFTGGSSSSTYSALVYRDGQLVGGMGGLTGAGPVIVEPIDFCDLHPDSPLCDELDDFDIDPAGACGWGFRYPLDRGFRLPDGQEVVGDELRLREELDPNGHYPYLSFDSMELTTSGEGLRIKTESVQ